MFGLSNNPVLYMPAVLCPTGWYQVNSRDNEWWRVKPANTHNGNDSKNNYNSPFTSCTTAKACIHSPYPLCFQPPLCYYPWNPAAWPLHSRISLLPALLLPMAVSLISASIYCLSASWSWKQNPSQLTFLFWQRNQLQESAKMLLVGYCSRILELAKSVFC